MMVDGLLGGGVGPDKGSCAFGLSGSVAKHLSARDENERNQMTFKSQSTSSTGSYRIIFICAKYREQVKDCAEAVLQLRPLFNRFFFFMNAFKPSPAAVHAPFLHF